MTSWFSTPERVGLLMRECEGWLSTPFSGNGATRGIGVSCQKLVGALYDATSAPGILATVPDEPMGYWRFARTSLVEPWLDGRKEFARVPDALARHAIPGDLIGFRLGRIVHHMGCAIDQPGRFIHCTESAGVNYASLSDSTWKQRFAIIWRPVP